MQGAAQQDLTARGVKARGHAACRGTCSRQQAQRRVTLGLILGEVVKKHGLQAKPEQVQGGGRRTSEELRASRAGGEWYHQLPERLREIESIVT